MRKEIVMSRMIRWVSGVAAGLALLATTGMRVAPRAGRNPATPVHDKPLIVLIRAADWMGHEWSEDAIRVGLQEADLEADRDYEIRTTSAQGDLATLPNLVDAALDAHARVIVTLQDATLEVAVRRVKTTPIVFHLLSDPFAAGAGTSDSSHLPNITGVYSLGFGDPEQSRRVDLIRRIVPNAKQLGILFSPEEQLSVIFKDRMTAAARRAGLEATAVPVSQLADIGQATRTLCSLRVDAIELYGNVAHAGFPSLIKEARGCRIPVFSPAPFEVIQGAVASIFPDFAEGGAVAGAMIARILKGESPAAIPFYRITTMKLAVNPGEAARAGAAVPPDMVEKADTVVGPHR
jgi:putative tryptophan/tyrosine transport system substrate-binding protein